MLKITFHSIIINVESSEASSTKLKINKQKKRRYQVCVYKTERSNHRNVKGIYHITIKDFGYISMKKS